MTSANKDSRFHVLFLAHDLSDATVTKHLQMLKLGGAAVTVAGFRRTSVNITDLCSCPTIDFGRTQNAGFIQRIFMVLCICINLRAYKAYFEIADVIIARNLEMLLIAVYGKKKYKKTLPVIYEVLDIHSLLLGSGVVSHLLRALEKKLLDFTKAILSSSPAYIVNYFCKLNPTSLPIRLLENKLLNPPPALISTLRAEAPWIIGWCGIIRCRKSLLILTELVLKSQNSIRVVIRGRPALDQIPDFHDIIAQSSGISFLGPYKNPTDLPAIYGSIHFNWTIDLYEEGLNSKWLLPNRIYEGSFYNTIPIALRNVETGTYLKKLGIGVLLKDPTASTLKEFFSKLTSSSYQTLKSDLEKIPLTQWFFDQASCEELTTYLRSLI